MIAASPRYIVVEGPIGVGKTSLARRLADSFACDLVEAASFCLRSTRSSPSSFENSFSKCVATSS